MKNINVLIDKYGTNVQLNGNTTKAFLDEQKNNQYKKSSLKSYSTFSTKVILTKEEINPQDEFLIYGKSYLVLEIIDIPTIGNEVVYCETGLFENDFINELHIYNQSLEMSGCNLPSGYDLSYLTVMSRIKTVKPNDYLQFSLQGAKVATHIFTIRYDNAIKISDLIHFGDRRFEILYLNNIDEMSIFLEMSCIEVLNA